MTGPHDVLGVKPGAGRAEVSAAYRRFALRNHPDQGGDPERFRAGADAYRQLVGDGTSPATSAGPGSDVVFHRRRRTKLGALLRRAGHSAQSAARARQPAQRAARAQPSVDHPRRPLR